MKHGRGKYIWNDVSRRKEYGLKTRLIEENLNLARWQKVPW
jgi:hypothetical protein